MSLDSAGRAMIAQQVKYHHDRLKLITSIRFTRGFLFEWLWLAYAGCQMMNMRQASEVQELHLNCDYECTMWILNQVNLFRCWGSCRYCYVIWLIHPCCWYVLFICPLPLCIHGNSCPVGQLPAIEQSQDQFLMMIIAMHIRQFLFI